MAGLRSNRSFVRLFLGRMVTNAGDSVYAIAASWLVWDLTRDPFYTGLVGSLTLATQTLQFTVGPLADRWSFRRILLGTQAVQLVGVLVVPLAAYTGHLSVWVVVLLAPLLAFMNQFVYPAQTAALPRIVGEEELVRANSLFSFANQGTNMVFAGLGGVVVAAVGAVTTYVLDAATFAVAIALFAGVHAPRRDDSGAEAAAADGPDPAGSDASEGAATADDGAGLLADYLSELREGFEYLQGSLYLYVLVGGILGNFGWGVMVALLPVLGASLGGAEAYGLLSMALSAGMLAGSAGATYFEDYPVGRVNIVGALALAACWVAAVLAPGLWPTVLLLGAAFVPNGVTSVVGTSMMQSAAADDIRARISSVATSVGTLLMPVGSLVGGVAADAVGLSTTLLAVGAIWGAMGVVFALIPGLRTLPRAADCTEEDLGFSRGSSTGTAD